MSSEPSLSQVQAITTLRSGKVINKTIKPTTIEPIAVLIPINELIEPESVIEKELEPPNEKEPSSLVPLPFSQRFKNP